MGTGCGSEFPTLAMAAAISAPSDSIISDFIFTDVRAPTTRNLTSRAQVRYGPEERSTTNPKGAALNEPSGADRRRLD
jgi:hypothetical protein